MAGVDFSPGSVSAHEHELLEQLPPCLDQRFWRTHNNWNYIEFQNRRTSQESIDFSIRRGEAIPWQARLLLRDLRESAAFWLALRKHLDVDDAIWILQVLKTRSTWNRDKTLAEEDLDQILRREYLTLFSECRLLSQDPDWRHVDMLARKLLTNRIVDI